MAKVRGLITQERVSVKQYGALTSVPGLVVAALMIFSACAPQYWSVPPPEVREVTINASKEDVVGRLTEEMVAAGFTLARSDSTALVFEKRDYRVLTARVGGEYWDPFPLWRVRFDISDTAHGTRVVGKAQVVTNPGTKYERITDMAGGIGPRSTHDLLKDVKEVCETPTYARKTPVTAETPAVKRDRESLKAPAGDGLREVTYPDGSTYVGEWKDNKMHGSGTYTWPNGVKYIGESEADRAIGGWLYGTDGSRIWVYQDSKGNWIVGK